jgi:hypothetical protein
MPIYDCRKDNREQGALYFPCSVRIVCGMTGKRIAHVFYASTSPAKLGRFIVGPDGEPMASPVRHKRYVPKPDGSFRVEYYNERLEVIEQRPWVAVSVKTGAVVAKSEGVT